MVGIERKEEEIEGMKVEEEEGGGVLGRAHMVFVAKLHTKKYKHTSR